MHIVDILRSAYLNEQIEDLLGEELEVNRNSPQIPIYEEKLMMFRNTTAADPEMQLLPTMIMNIWPKEKILSHKDVQAYWTFKEEHSYSSGMLFKAAKLIVPNQLCQGMLNKLN